MRTLSYLLLVFVSMISSCTIFDNPQERRYTNKFLAGKDSCQNKYTQHRNGVYIRVVDNLPATDSHYHVYYFRKGKVNHYKHVLGTDQPVDSLLKEIKILEARNQRHIMNHGVYYCEGDTIYVRNFNHDAHGLTIKHLIEDSRMIIKAGGLTVIGRKKMTEREYKPVNEEYYYVGF